MSIRLDNIEKRFGDFPALHGVSLEARPGEFLALLGPSGSGKTTLLRIMAGLEFPDTGSVSFEGKDVTGLAVRERGVGFVFQQYALFRHMSVAENIAFGLRVKKRRDRPSRTQIAARVEELLELVQLGGLGGRYPAQLSGGQRQRVALARALAVEPRLLLLDEPFGALDAKVRKDLRRWLRDLHDRMGITSIFVTHDQEEALELADRVVVMNHGVIEQVASPQELYDNPGSPYVFDFVGESNRLPVQSRDGRIFVDGSPLDLKPATAFEGQGELFFRPHDVKLVEPEEGTLAVRVSHVRRRGGTTRVEGVVPGPEIPIEIFISGRKAPEPGQTIALALSRGSVFPKDKEKAE